MKRRSFLKAGTLVTAPLIIQGIPVMAAPSTGNELLDMLAQTTYGCGKILVIVQMNGGNDALNMVFPRDKWSQLSAARSNILMNETDVLPLNGNATTGLHPAMPEMKNLYDNGKLMIVQGVSYPNPNFSHFRATDIWFSASSSSTVLDTGWLGRSLTIQYPGFPNGYPNTNMMDPLAIQIGSTLPFSLQGPGINLGYNVPNPNSLLNVINGTTDPAPNNDYGRELSFLRLMKDQSNAYRTAIQTAYNVAQPQAATYPASNSLADQLKIVAKLINGGLKTPVYIVNHPNSHDTHENQVDQNDKKLGTHANLLTILSKAVGAFQADLGLMGKADKVTGMTYSEFGRRIKSNASFGTDHGVGAPVMFFGASLNTSATDVAGTANPIPGMIGTSPNLPANATVNDQVPMQYDFRQLYASVMKDWLCLSDAETTSVLGSAFSTIPIFKTGAVLPLEGIELIGQYLNGEAKLNYKVEDNTHFSSFNVQFSDNGVRFDDVNTIINTSLNDNESYYFNHATETKKMFYRIAGKKRNGEIKFSNTLILRSNAKDQLISVYPNPVTNFTLNVKLFETPQSSVDITIYNMTGAKIYYNKFNQTGTLITFRIPPVTKNAHYVLEIIYDGTTAHEQIMFQ